MAQPSACTVTIRGRRAAAIQPSDLEVPRTPCRRRRAVEHASSAAIDRLGFTVKKNRHTPTSKRPPDVSAAIRPCATWQPQRDMRPYSRPRRMRPYVRPAAPLRLEPLRTRLRDDTPCRLTRRRTRVARQRSRLDGLGAPAVFEGSIDCADSSSLRSSRVPSPDAATRATSWSSITSRVAQTARGPPPADRSNSTRTIALSAALYVAELQAPHPHRWRLRANCPAFLTARAPEEGHCRSTSAPSLLVASRCGLLHGPPNVAITTIRSTATLSRS